MQAGAAIPLALTLDSSGEVPMPGTQESGQQVGELQRIVKLSGDGPSMTPVEYAHFLNTIVSQGEVEADYYSNGGVVEALELRMAQILGKERAVFLPTGTLANHLAVRIQAGDRSRVIVQKESHLHRVPHSATPGKTLRLRGDEEDLCLCPG
jgi:hypothetical protein